MPEQQPPEVRIILRPHPWWSTDIIDRMYDCGMLDMCQTVVVENITERAYSPEVVTRHVEIIDMKRPGEAA